MKKQMNLNKINPAFIKILFILIAVSFLTTTCKKDKDQPDNTAEPSVNNYLVNLPSWDVFSPYKADDDSQDPSIQAFDCSDKLIETTTPCSITRSPEDIVTCDPGSEILYLGSLIQGDGYKGGLGSIKSLPIYQRAPITIIIDVPMPENSRVVENPGLASVNQAVADLRVAAQNSGQQTASSISFKTETCHSVSQLALSLGLSFKKMKQSVSLDLAWVHEKEKNTVSAYFIQKMFTVSIANPQRPGDFFSADFTQELLDEQISLGRIGPNNLPVYVSNIVYGRMMLFTMTSTHSADSMGLALDARFKKINVDIDGKYQTIINNSTFTLTTIGGEAQDALDFISSGKYGAFFAENPPLTTAVPISYTLRNLGDNDKATVSETTDYDMVQYEPISLISKNQVGQWEYIATNNNLEKKDWHCDLINVKKADEEPSFIYTPIGEVFMYNKINYSMANTGYPFNFYLENIDPAPNGHAYALVYNDNGWWPYKHEAISIGDTEFFTNDDFSIGVSGPPGTKVYAIGFKLFGNAYYTDESVSVFAKDKNGDECIIYNYVGGISDFFGVISPVPITRIEFNENPDDTDNILIENIYFGYKVD